MTEDIDIESGRSASAEFLLWTRLTPFRVQAMDLGFVFLRRDCSYGGSVTARNNVFLHPRGTWLDLHASIDRGTVAGRVMATFSSWCADDGEIIEIETVAATPAPSQPAARRAIARIAEFLRGGSEMHPLDSAASLAALCADHERTLHQRGLVPLIAAEEPLEQRRRWERMQRANVWLVAPP